MAVSVQKAVDSTFLTIEELLFGRQALIGIVIIFLPFSFFYIKLALKFNLIILFFQMETFFYFLINKN